MPDLGEILKHPILCIVVIGLACLAVAVWIVLEEEAERREGDHE